MTRKVRVMTPREVAYEIKDGDTVVSGGFAGSAHPEELTSEIERCFHEIGQPRDMTLVFASGQGDRGGRGISHFAHKGMLRRVVGGFFSLNPPLQKAILAGEVEAHNFPQGIMVHLFRDIAAGKPGTLSQVGLGTFADPRHGGGKLNSVTFRDLVEIMKIDGEEWLFYRTFPLNVALLRGTTSDALGNISIEREAVTSELLSIAQAVKNCGGKVFVQVERLDESLRIDPKDVRIPFIFVDGIVVARRSNHPQTFDEDYNPLYTGEERTERPDIKALPPGEKRVICFRAFAEIKEGDIVNLGIGTSDGVAAVAAELGKFDHCVFTIESGAIGGVPARGLSFGAAANVQALIDQPYMFDFYDGGGLNVTCLGMAECGPRGDVNVSKFGSKLPGAGGFVNIVMSAKKIVFCGPFTAKGLEVSVEGGKLRIVKEGALRKFTSRVEQVTFSAETALAKGKTVLYVTERCVFRLTKDGLVLSEVAPGIDVERDILGNMDFKPMVPGELKEMQLA